MRWVKADKDDQSAASRKNIKFSNIQPKLRESPGWLVLDVWLTAPCAQLRPLVKHLNQDVRAATAKNHIDWIRIHSHLLQFS